MALQDPGFGIDLKIHITVPKIEILNSSFKQINKQNPSSFITSKWKNYGGETVQAASWINSYIRDMARPLENLYPGHFHPLPHFPNTI